MPNISQEDRDKLSPVWDMSQERAFMEKLLNQRFNFFLIFFSLVIGASLNSKTQFHLQIILTIGFVISWFLALVIFRAQRKLDFILNALFADESHPAAIVDATFKHKGSRRKIIGYLIPTLCCLLLFIGAVLSFLKIFII